MIKAFLSVVTTEVFILLLIIIYTVIIFIQTPLKLDIGDKPITKQEEVKHKKEILKDMYKLPRNKNIQENIELIEESLKD